VRKPEEIVKKSYKWEDNIKINLKRNWVYLVRDLVQFEGPCEHSTETFSGTHFC
jgi:hypothetical protein